MTKKILPKSKTQVVKLWIKTSMSNAQFTVKLPTKSWGNLDTKLENIYIYIYIYGKTGYNWDPKVDKIMTSQTFFFLRSQPGNLGRKFIEK